MFKRSFAVLAAAALLPAVIALIAFPQVQTESQVTQPAIVVFYEEGCPDCVQMEGALEELVVGHDELVIVRYEINEPGMMDLLWKLSSHYGVLATSVPVIFVGEEAIVGAGRAEEFHLRTAVDDCITYGCPSPLAYAEGPGFPRRDLLVLGAFVVLFVLLFYLQGG